MGCNQSKAQEASNRHLQPQQNPEHNYQLKLVGIDPICWQSARTNEQEAIIAVEERADLGNFWKTSADLPPFGYRYT